MCPSPPPSSIDLDFISAPKNTTESVLPDPQAELTISVSRAAELLGVAVSTVYDAIHRGDIPCITIGNRFRVPTQAFLTKVLQISDRTMTEDDRTLLAALRSDFALLADLRASIDRLTLTVAELITQLRTLGDDHRS